MTPPASQLALIRLRDTRARIAAAMWAARAVVIRAQLQAMRGTW